MCPQFGMSHKIFHHYAAGCCIKCMIIKICVCAYRLQKEVLPAQCAFAQRLTCPHSAVVSAQRLCACALYGRAHRETIPCLCICVWDVGLGYSAVQIAEPPRTNGCRHLLSLVSQMEKGRTIQSEQSRVTNEGDISAERQADRQQRGQGSGKQKWRTSRARHTFLCQRGHTVIYNNYSDSDPTLSLLFSC